MNKKMIMEQKEKRYQKVIIPFITNNKKIHVKANKFSINQQIIFPGNFHIDTFVLLYTDFQQKQHIFLKKFA